MPLLINRCLQIPIHELRDVFFAAEAFRLFDLEDFAHRCWLYICRNAAQLVNSEAFLQMVRNRCLNYSNEIVWRSVMNLNFGKQHSVWPTKSAVEMAKNAPLNFHVLTEKEVITVYQFHCHPTFVTGQRSLLFSKFGRIGDWNVPKENGGTLAFEIENFSSVAAESSWRCWSHPTILIKGLPGKTLAEIPQDNGGKKWLGLYLQFAAENLRASWCCKCSKTLRIRSHSNEDDYMKAYNHVFNNENIYYGWEHFIQITELMDPIQGLNDIGN
ncbi:hypothetical protein niasHT_023425 [Heterodera trifolii]|uniref:MATH domain-containing protein n=1 Tax=Heterodera trifolii TaxID=157864 RepID=A0ABD2K413_9BILA